MKWLNYNRKCIGLPVVYAEQAFLAKVSLPEKVGVTLLLGGHFKKELVPYHLESTATQVNYISL